MLVAVDFSSGAEAAFEWAADLASAIGAPLYVLHVAHDPLDEPGYYSMAGRGEVPRIEEVGREMLDAFMRAEREKRPGLADLAGVESELVVGLPVTRILEVAEREGAQVIVMGGKGRTALADALLGSKVERVAHLSPIPVVVVKTGPGAAPAEAL